MLIVNKQHAAVTVLLYSVNLKCKFSRCMDPSFKFMHLLMEICQTAQKTYFSDDQDCLVYSCLI
jgi:hypothetical protein